nr:secondary thiamine-phosphate synthase enzyme YjbQ [Pseudodesulfovibrio alkaliphilus]
MSIRTREREEMLDITGPLRALIRANGWNDGLLLLHCPHTTGAVTVNEGADPDVARDMVINLRKLVPQRGDYHHAEGNSDAHIKSSLLGCDQTLMIEGGDIRLGTWQKVFFCEFDGPRSRSLWVKFVGGR